MNLKPIEMQIAIPRTQQASELQNQLLHKPAADQQLLAERSSRQAQEKLQKANQVESTPHARIEEDPREAREREQSRKRKSDPEVKAQSEATSDSVSATPASHPYKGRHIDFSL